MALRVNGMLNFTSKSYRNTFLPNLANQILDTFSLAVSQRWILVHTPRSPFNFEQYADLGSVLVGIGLCSLSRLRLCPWN